jgi:hypothetical protein
MFIWNVLLLPLDVQHMPTYQQFATWNRPQENVVRNLYVNITNSLVHLMVTEWSVEKDLVGISEVPNC